MNYLRIRRSNDMWQWALYKRSGHLLCASNYYNRWDGLMNSLKALFGTSTFKVTVDGKHRGILEWTELSELPRTDEDEE